MYVHIYIYMYTDLVAAPQTDWFPWANLTIRIKAKATECTSAARPHDVSGEAKRRRGA